MEQLKQKFAENQTNYLFLGNIPKRYKRNPINGDMNRAKRIATDFENEIVQIKEKFLAANFHQDL